MTDSSSNESPFLKINEARLRGKVLALVQHLGSQVAAARSIGCSASYLNDYLNGRRAAGDKILKAFDLQRVVLYAPVSKDFP